VAVNYATTLKSARMTAVINAIDVNASPAFIEICTASYAAVIVTITLSDPSFVEGSPPGTITMLSPPKSGTASLAGTNTAAVARIKDGGGNVIVNNLTVASPSGGDINLNSTSITLSQVVTITAATITHAT
jgi:hypothetical protein